MTGFWDVFNNPLTDSVNGLLHSATAALAFQFAVPTGWYRRGAGNAPFSMGAARTSGAPSLIAWILQPTSMGAPRAAALRSSSLEKKKKKESTAHNWPVVASRCAAHVGGLAAGLARAMAPRPRVGPPGGAGQHTQALPMPAAALILHTGTCGAMRLQESAWAKPTMCGVKLHL
jgi:hypothetical protein